MIKILTKEITVFFKMHTLDLQKSAINKITKISLTEGLSSKFKKFPNAEYQKQGKERLRLKNLLNSAI